MIKSIVKESPVTFKKLKQTIFAYVCEAAVEMTQIILEDYDRELHENRNKKKYRDKGYRATIKTIYDMPHAPVTYTRPQVKTASCVTENPYRVTADIISSTSSQRICHGEV